MYHCLKFQDDKQQMSECWQLKEDGHCLHCPCYQSDESTEAVTDETKVKVLSTFLDVANLALGKNKKGEK